MSKLFVPKDYCSRLSLMETEIALKKLKDYFEKTLAKELELTRVSAPLFVFSETGLNDDLNGIERAVKFDIRDLEYKSAEIVHSLAKWKRLALHRYGFEIGKGLYTDMNAIRRDEELDNTHSIYVDQWDWEKVITKKERSIDKLKVVVRKIYKVFKMTEKFILKDYPELCLDLPEEIEFISSEELVRRYPNMQPKERENAICREKKAVFLIGIGGKLSNGEKHDGRAPDYDDWRLNGDILFWNPILQSAFELSSMGIRVDRKALLEQLKDSDCEARSELEFHKMVLEEKLPFTIGGGIGQSRICMYFLNKAHIGEVQASIWPEEMQRKCDEFGILLL